MFGKKKKRVEISAPSNFEHRVHTGFDQHEQKFTGLPRQWQSLIEESARRPKPLVDPACITSIQHEAPKVCGHPPLPLRSHTDPHGGTPALNPALGPVANISLLTPIPHDLQTHPPTLHPHPHPKWWPSPTSPPTDPLPCLSTLTPAL